MKFIDEYRDINTIKILSDKIHSICTGEWTIMEVCGGQTHTILKYGIEDLLPDCINILHGPGCPVCVTPADMIDKAINLSLRKDVVLASFGDMLRVPGSGKDLLYAKALGADLRIIYSPLDAVKIAENEKEKMVVLFAIGFETTAPANAASLIYAKKKNLLNFFMLSSHKIILPAVELILSSPASKVEGLLAPGHVCTVTGYSGFSELSLKYHVPAAVTGFEPADILQGVLSVIRMLESKRYQAENQYSRSVRREGNAYSRKLIEEVFEAADSNWRGIGMIPMSGLKIRKKYADFDAESIFDIKSICSEISTECIAGDVLQGIKKPDECSAFGNGCTPLRPLGAPMVSSEGACAAYYNYKKRRK